MTDSEFNDLMQDERLVETAASCHDAAELCDYARDYELSLEDAQRILEAMPEI